MNTYFSWAKLDKKMKWRHHSPYFHFYSDQVSFLWLIVRFIISFSLCLCVQTIRQVEEKTGRKRLHISSFLENEIFTCCDLPFHNHFLVNVLINENWNDSNSNT